MKAALLILALAATSVHADEWTGPDKTKHAAAGALIAGVSAPVIGKDKAFWLGAGVGLAKEVADYRSKQRGGAHQPSYKDFAVTAAGSALGAYVPGLVIGRRSISYSWEF